MKKLLLLSLAAISAASIQAQPVVQDARFTTTHSTYSGNLVSLVRGGNPPYTYARGQVTGDDLEVTVTDDGNFIAAVPMSYNGDAQFQYTATDSNDNESNPGTITITFRPEKG